MAVKYFSRDERQVVFKEADVEHQRLACAARQGEALNIRQLVHAHPTLDLNEVDTTGNTCLGIAVQLGHEEVIEVLLKAGADVNRADFYGLTPLQYVAETEFVTIAKTLIAAGANLDWMDINNDGLSALHIAACKGCHLVAEEIIKAGANIDAQDHCGVSVLHCAVSNGNHEVVKCLLSAKVKVNVAGIRTQRTPLFLAIDGGDLTLVNLLLTHGAKTNFQDRFGFTVLCMSCLRNDDSTARRLLAAGARVNIANSKGHLPLHYAARNGNANLCRSLLDAGSNFDVLDEFHESPLHLAIRMNHLDAVRVLIDSGCNVNLCHPEESVTPLHIAVTAHWDVRDFEQVLEMLVSRGADLNILSNDKTPLWQATEDAKSDIARVLVEHGADANIEGPHGITVLHKACRHGDRKLVTTLLHSGLDWCKEMWLAGDAYNSGIRPDLVTDYTHGVPMALHGKQDLLHAIKSVQHATLSLQHLARLAFREAARSRLYVALATLPLPLKMQNFLMLRIL